MNDSDLDKTAGRTPWDVAAILVSRLGPTTIVVIGFLAVTGFLFNQIIEADTRARKLLVENTSRMNLMSAQLIKNIDEMMALNKKVADERKANRKLYESDLKKVQDDLEQAQKDLAETLQQVKDARAEVGRAMKDLARREAEWIEQRRSLVIAQKEFKVELDGLEKKRRELELVLLESARQLEESEKPAALVAPTTVDDEVPAASPLRQILEAFADNPSSQEARDALKNLTGQRYESLEAAIKKDGIGFDVWFYSNDVKRGRRTVWGYMTQEADGPRNFIRLNVVNDRITNTTYRQANVLSKIPKAENWYERWMCDLVVVNDDKLLDFYSAENISQWDQLSLLEQRYPNRDFENGILHGEVKRFEVVSLDGFRSAFPDHYAIWKKRTDAFGRPSVILAMMERAKDFDASNLAGMPSPDVADGLAEAIAKLLKSAIDEDTAVLRHVAPRFGRGELGAIAAMALRATRLEVVDVRPQSSVLQQAKPEELFEMIFSLEKERTRRRTPREGRLVFAWSGGGWELREFSSPF